MAEPYTLYWERWSGAILPQAMLGRSGRPIGKTMSIWPPWRTGQRTI